MRPLFTISEQCMKNASPLYLVLLALAACSGGSPASLPDGRPIDVAGFEAYTTNHDGSSRVRRSYATAADAAAVAAFEDGDPAGPAGYRSLIAVNEARYGGRLNVEVIAEVETPDGPASRLVRLTVDQSPFSNVSGGELIAATGQFYLRGANYTWATIDGGPLLQGSDENGLVNMVIDFDTETVALNLRTGVDSTSALRSEITADDLPLNIRTGAYGGDITVQVWDPDSPAILSADGTLRGNLGGTPDYTDNIKTLSTSGLYTAEGVDPVTGQLLHVDGVFYGVDPNAPAQ